MSGVYRGGGISLMVVAPCIALSGEHDPVQLEWQGFEGEF